MNSIVLATALLAGIVGASSALNAEPGQWATAGSASSIQELSAGLVGDSHKGIPFTLLTKYIIRPSIAKEFVGGWLKFREIVKEAKGSKTINLSKPLSNNLVFYSYEEWTCKESFFNFVKNSSAAHELIEYIEEHDIPIIFTQLVPAVPYHKPNRTSASVADVASQVAGMSMQALSELINDSQDTGVSEDSVSEGEEFKMSVRNNTVIILTKYLVKPSKIMQFVKAADLVTKAVAANEKDNLVYGLSKTLDDDVTFWSYAIWEDEAALKKHIESSYVKVFIKYILAQDIYLKATPLLPIEQIAE